MKSLSLFIIPSISLATIACDQPNKAAETREEKTEAIYKSITLADFKKIKGVDNVQAVPFQLFTRLDSIRFFVAPDKEAAHLKVAYNKFDNYYGFEEFDDFYSIHYSIDNNVSNSIEAFVLRSEFTAAFDLTLQGIDLYEIRSSTFKDSNDTQNKSFAQYGVIEEVSEQAFNTAFLQRTGEVLVKSPGVRLQDNNWIYTEEGKENIIIQYENVSTEDGTLSNEYVGRSAFLDLEVFKESNEETAETYYTFYKVTSDTKIELITSGYPQILPAKKWLSSISSNHDVGSDFIISRYIPESKKQVNLLYVNFTGFRIADDKKAFWTDDSAFYAEVYPLNSAPADGQEQKTSFIKIQLKDSLF